MFKKEIERKFLVDRTKLPNLLGRESIQIIQGYLSGQHDNIEVRVRYSKYGDDTETYELIIKDMGLKKRNEITYKISKDEFDLSIILCGNKVINKTRYLIPNSFDNTRIMELDVYKDINLVVCEYEDENEVAVDSLPMENWFIREITNDISYKNSAIAYNIHKFK